MFRATPHDHPLRPLGDFLGHYTGTRTGLDQLTDLLINLNDLRNR